MDGDKVVGVVSDREIFVTLFKILEAEEDRTRITLTNVALERGTLTKILSTVEETGAKARSIFTVPEAGSTRSGSSSVWRRTIRPRFSRPWKITGIR